MKKGKKVFFVLQIIFLILTFVGLVLLLLQKIDNAGLSVVSMVFSVAFGSMYNNSKKKKVRT